MTRKQYKKQCRVISFKLQRQHIKDRRSRKAWARIRRLFVRSALFILKQSPVAPMIFNKDYDGRYH